MSTETSNVSTYRDANGIMLVVERFLADNPEFSTDQKLAISRAATTAQNVKEFWKKVEKII